MRIAVFTSNQPRHLALIRDLSEVADEVFAVQECNTVFPGHIDDFFPKSSVMQDYFARVMAAEARIFGKIEFLPANVRTLSIKTGDLNLLGIETFTDALQSDFFVVFGASFIKGQLAERLIAGGAINIHMGVSPYFRGSSCNFWAVHDGHAGLVGATIHKLSKGLDSGPMLFHALPAARPYDPFDLGMVAVSAAHKGLVSTIRRGELLTMPTLEQDKTRQIRYSRADAFTDEVAGRYLENLPTPEQIGAVLTSRDSKMLFNPFFI